MRLCKMARFCAMLRFLGRLCAFFLPKKDAENRKSAQNSAKMCEMCKKRLYALPPLVMPPFACHRQHQDHPREHSREQCHFQENSRVASGALWRFTCCGLPGRLVSDKHLTGQPPSVLERTPPPPRIVGSVVWHPPVLPFLFSLDKDKENNQKKQGLFIPTEPLTSLEKKGKNTQKSKEILARSPSAGAAKITETEIVFAA